MKNLIVTKKAIIVFKTPDRPVVEMHADVIFTPTPQGWLWSTHGVGVMLSGTSFDGGHFKTLEEAIMGFEGYGKIVD